MIGTIHAFKPQPLHTLKEIRADILALEKETDGLLGERQINGALFERAVLNLPKISTALRELKPQAGVHIKDAYANPLNGLIPISSILAA
jgi:hypothetical protein